MVRGLHILVVFCCVAVVGCLGGSAGGPDEADQSGPTQSAQSDLCAGVGCSGIGRCIDNGAGPSCVCPHGYVTVELSCQEDFDLDAIHDFDEAELARILSPRLVYSIYETHSAKLPHWTVWLQGDGETVWISIFYALAYARDGGDPDLGGFSSHLGDSEFIAIDVQVGQDGTILNYLVFLSAHYRAITDASGWFDGDAFQFEDTDEGIHPYVWVAVGKHANYASESRCEAGAAFQDSCDVGWVEPIDIDIERHLGHSYAPLIDEASFLFEGRVYTEHFFTDQRFCGWNVPEGGDRSLCTGINNSYARQIAAWEQGQL